MCGGVFRTYGKWNEFQNLVTFRVTSERAGTMETDVDYFTRRAAEERRAAMKAAHPTAREAHLEMAERYAELAGAIEAHQVRMGVGFATESIS